MLNHTLAVLCCEEQLTKTDLPPGFEWHETRTDENPPAAAVLESLHGWDSLARSLSPAILGTLPIIGLSPEIAGYADMLVPDAAATIAEALVKLRPACERMSALPPHYATLTDEAWILLGYLAVRDHGLHPALNPQKPAVADYGERLRFVDIEASAEILTLAGCLERHFGERVNLCPECRSARLLLREECEICHGGDIRDEAIIHHFACAYEAPEHEFCRGDELICPKCCRVLRHFSLDHDRPGTLTACNNCGHVTAEPRLGFRCLDCGLHDESGHLVSHDVPLYRLTPAGRATVFDPAWRPEPVKPAAPENDITRKVSAFLEGEQEGQEQRIAAIIKVLPATDADSKGHGLPTESLMLAAHIIKEHFPAALVIAAPPDEYALLFNKAEPQSIYEGLEQAEQNCKRLINDPLMFQAHIETRLKRHISYEI